MKKPNQPFTPIKDSPTLQFQCPDCNSKKPMKIDEIETSVNLDFGFYTIFFDVNCHCEKCETAVNFLHSVLVAESVDMPVSRHSKFDEAIDEDAEV